MKNNSNLRSLLKHCNREFYPYVVKVLNRLSKYVRDKDILLDSKLKIISFDDRACDGLFIPFGSSVENIIILNENLLSRPEFEITYTIAHELAHKVVGKGKTALREMEAENLVVEWGFETESKAARYHRPILETEGFKIGYEWAKGHDLTAFEEFYDEWNEGRLSRDRYEALHYEADTTSILSVMGYFEESQTVSPDSKQEVPEDAIVEDGSLDKGIIEGIMCFLREKKAQTLGKEDYLSDRKSDFMEQLKRTNAEILKIFDHSLFHEYINKLYALSKASLQIIDVLEDQEVND